MENQERITSLENDVTSLSKSVGSLESDVRNLVGSVDSLARSTKDLQNMVLSNNRTNWSTLAAWAAVLVTFMGSLGYLAFSPTQDRLEHIVTEVERHKDIEGHPSMVERQQGGDNLIMMRIDAVEEKVDRILNEQLRRTERVYRQQKWNQ